MSSDNAPRVLSSDGGCPCFYPDPVPEAGDPEFQSDQCACGHALDEHDDTGQCQAQEVYG